MNGKTAVRRRLGALIAGLSEEQRRQESAKLCSLLFPWAVQQGFETVLATLPLDDEPDLTPFLGAWLASGRVALARTLPRSHLEFGFITDLEGPWKTHGMLREPPDSAPLWTPETRTLVLVPGLGFAPAEGGAWRLGRGGGYYDRWLALVGDSVVSLGVGYSVQTLSSLPVETHDQKLAGWADPAGIHGFKS